MVQEEANEAKEGAKGGEELTEIGGGGGITQEG